MLFIKSHKGNKALRFISFFIFLPAVLLCQQKPQPLSLVYGECNNNCYQPELKELHWAHDTLQLVFSTENPCNQAYYTSVENAQPDSLVIGVDEYGEGLRGSKQSVSGSTRSTMCLCYYNYTLTLTHVKQRPSVILINHRPFYMLKSMKGDHIIVRDHFKNQSAQVSTADLGKLLGQKYASPRLKKLYAELGQDSIPESSDDVRRYVNFPEDHIILGFDRAQTLQTIGIDEGYKGALPRGIGYASPCSACLSALGKPSQSRAEDGTTYDEQGNEHSVPRISLRYYFRKYKLLLDCNNKDQVTSIRFIPAPHELR